MSLFIVYYRFKQVQINEGRRSSRCDVERMKWRQNTEWMSHCEPSCRWSDTDVSEARAAQQHPEWSPHPGRPMSRTFYQADVNPIKGLYDSLGRSLSFEILSQVWSDCYNRIDLWPREMSGPAHTNTPSMYWPTVSRDWRGKCCCVSRSSTSSGTPWTVYTGWSSQRERLQGVTPWWCHTRSLVWRLKVEQRSNSMCYKLCLWSLKVVILIRKGRSKKETSVIASWET